MKTFNRTYLPDSVVYNGITYTYNAALTAAASINNTSHTFISNQLKLQNRKAVCVQVLSRNLKGKTNLYGKPYQPTQHIFTT